MNIFCLILILFLTSVNAANAATLKGVIRGRRLRSYSNIAVCLKPNGKFFVKLPLKNPVMDQRRLKFIPELLVIPKGSTVDFPNNDETIHNLFSPDMVADRFNFGNYRKGDMRSHTFKKAGAAALLCNRHDEMEAFIYICDSHLFAITDRKGNYTIKDIPPGEYILKTWHKKLKTDSRDITVRKGKQEFNLELKR